MIQGFWCKKMSMATSELSLIDFRETIFESNAKAKDGNRNIKILNVFIGFNSGQTELGNNLLVIENSNAAAGSRLVEGDFSAREIRFDAQIRHKAKNAVPGNATLKASEMVAYLDESNDKLIFKVKYSDGTTVKTIELLLI